MSLSMCVPLSLHVSVVYLPVCLSVCICLSLSVNTARGKIINENDLIVAFSAN